MKHEIVLLESEDGEVKLGVELGGDTAWLTEDQMAALFGRDEAEIARHIANVYEEGEADREATCAKIAQTQAEDGAGSLSKRRRSASMLPF
ncbi:hypothetical protein [Slackia isoflavoniconvertens]|uniref:hypothetical protein n=1 Tax=Slackia isoflavoniconvertens TaxID=572010 RepID=UPI003AB950F8